VCVFSEVVIGAWQPPTDESTHKQAVVSFAATKKELSWC